MFSIYIYALKDVLNFKYIKFFCKQFAFVVVNYEKNN